MSASPDRIARRVVAIQALCALAVCAFFSPPPSRAPNPPRPDLAVSHAAFHFLEALGCRWYFPAKEWEVVPSRRTLSVSLHETERPRLLSRRIWYGYGSFADKGHPRGGSTQKDYEAWARHNKM